MRLSREWAMPSAQTFTIAPIAALLRFWLQGCDVVIDPFARNSRIATHRNDLNPDTAAESHLPVEDFCAALAAQRVRADAVLFDPPYSPRQIAECYQAIGRAVSTEDTQNSALYRRVRDGLDALLKPHGIAISCGWNSAGFGEGRGYDPLELLVVTHGGAHNDTLVIVERKREPQRGLFA